MTDDFIPYTPGDPIPTGRVRPRLRGGYEHRIFVEAADYYWGEDYDETIVAYEVEPPPEPTYPRPATWTPPNPPGETIQGTILHVIGELAWFRYQHRPDGAEHNEVVPLRELRSE